MLIGLGIFLGVAGLIMGGAALGVSADANQKNQENATDSLDLQREQFEYQQGVDLQEERTDIVAQANNAAMQIDTLEQSAFEAGYYSGYYRDLAGQKAVEREDALSMFDSSAAKTVGSQKVAQALSGAKIDAGTAVAVASETRKSLASDRTSMKNQYDADIGNQMSLSSFYSEAQAGYNSQIKSYDTLLTDIYNTNKDWMTPDAIGEYGGQYNSWLTERVGK